MFIKYQEIKLFKIKNNNKKIKNDERRREANEVRSSERK